MKWLIAGTLAALLTAAVGASYITVISSFDPNFAGVPSAQGVEFDGSQLWTSAGGWLVKRLYPTGRIISSYRIDVGLPVGMAWDGNYIYANGCLARHIYKIEPRTGSTASSFPFPSGTTWSGGLAYDGRDLLFAALFFPYVWRMSTDGSILASFRIVPDYPCGLAYDDRTPGGPYLWCSDEPFPEHGKSSIYMFTTTGSLVDYVRWPVPNSNLCGLAFDGTYLWCIETPGQNWVYQVLYVSDSGVTPVSMGRIKATYR